MTIDDSYSAYIQDSNPDSLTSLMNALRSYATAIAHLYRRSDAEDVASDVVAKSWTAMCSFHGRSSFKTWFRSLAVNHLNSLIRSERQEHACMDREMTIEQAVLRAPRTHRPISANFEHLTQEQILVVKILIDSEDFSETANRLGITRKAVEHRLARIKDKCSR
jgi:RNA polymerase sigma factor (sigma-70 family)